MISREEVAKRLRKNSTAHSADEALQIICKCTVRAMRGSKSVMEVLADLIDPTCHAIVELEPDGIGAPHRYTIRCSNCGQLWSETGGTLRIPDYCPTCGSRVVVSEDE